MSTAGVDIDSLLFNSAGITIDSLDGAAAWFAHASPVHTAHNEHSVAIHTADDNDAAGSGWLGGRSAANACAQRVAEHPADS